jgi:hypothetical protein
MSKSRLDQIWQPWVKKAARDWRPTVPSKGSVQDSSNIPANFQDEIKRVDLLKDEAGIETVSLRVGREPVRPDESLLRVVVGVVHVGDFAWHCPHHQLVYRIVKKP